MKIMKTFIYSTMIITLLLGSGSVFAQKTYTPAQLNKMVDSGSFPKQGPVKTQSQSMAFSACIAKVEAVIGSDDSNYPAKTIASSDVVRMVKLWTNDAAMTLTCSAADSKITITKAPYI